MIAIGIDPGTTRIGYGVIQSDRNKMSCIAYGILATTGDKLVGFQEAEKQLTALIKKYKPDVAGIEKLFFFKNQKTICLSMNFPPFRLNKISAPMVEPAKIKSNAWLKCC